MSLTGNIFLKSHFFSTSKSFIKTVSYLRYVKPSRAFCSLKSESNLKDENVAPESDVSVEKIQQKLDDCIKENKEFSEKITELTDKYKRSLAEMENVRTRLMKQADDAKVFAVQGFAKDLLSVADSLTQASKSVSAASSQIHDDGNFRALYDGLLLTDSQLHQVFKKHGLQKVDPAVGEKFDPKYHEALFQQDPVNGEASGSVSVVQKVGYCLHERCVRAAIVGVFK